MTTEKSDLAKLFQVADPPEITDADTSLINSGAAVLVNKMYATVMPFGMRITFAEANPATQVPAFRTAVFLSYQDAAALYDLLHRQLQKVEVLPVPLGVVTSGDTK